MKNKLLLIPLLFLFACEIIFVEDISEQSVVLLSPSNNAEIPKGVIRLDWESLVDANEYRVQVAIPNFQNASQILLDSVISNTTITKELDVNNYQWRVRALNSDYATAYTINTFKVIDTAFVSKNVNLLLPLDKDTTNIKKQNLLWEVLQEANSYRLQVWQPDTNGTKLEDINVTANSYSFEFPDGDFTWNVRAEKATKNTVFSSRTITVDSTEPNVPSLDLPKDNTLVLANTSIQFTWTRAAIIGTQELDSIYFYSDASLQNLIFKDVGLNNKYTKDNLTTGIYFWHVKAFDRAGNESDLSNIHSLTID